MKYPTALLLLIVLLLAGCGQKGPLFLPGHAPESQTEGAFGLDDGNNAQDEAGAAQKGQDTATTQTDESPATGQPAKQP